ncbi:MAG: molybdopterin molybdotransferase MoeA [Actinomycetota bacterium]
MLTVEEARKRVLDAVHPLAVEDALISDALWSVLARDQHAPHPLPRFDNSAMDGFAVRGADAAGASETSPVRLDVVGEVRAGDPGDARVEDGTAVRIMTGGALPPGADAIAPIEEVEESRNEVVVMAPTPAGRHVRPAGDDIAAGDLLVAAGTELGPGEIALLASMGLSPVPVRGSPKVAVLVTGDELVDPEAVPGPGQIRDSNSVALRALVAEAGARVAFFERVPDERLATLEAFKRAADLADLVLSSGGVAVGKYDFVKDVIEELGHIDLWRVAMQPGKPVVLGEVGSTTFLGLPGNPVSIHVGFEQFVRPAIRKMRGCRSLLRPTLRATLTAPIEKHPGRLHFVRVRLRADGEEWRATPTGPQGSHIQSSLVDCHGVARFGIDESHLDVGDPVVVDVWRLPDAEETG